MMKIKSLVKILAFTGCSAIFGAAYGQDVLKFGAPLALTGALADAGNKSKQGYDMCVSAVNAKGGVNVGGRKLKLELVEYDYQSETNRAVQIVQRLVNVDKVPFLFAPYGSGDTKATAVVAERYGIPMMAAAAATPSVFDQNFQNLFGVLFSNKMITDQEVRYQKQNSPDVKTVAVLALNSLFPKSIANDFVTSAKAGGYSVVFESIYSNETVDFSNVLTQLKVLKPDWIYVTGYTQGLILIRRQMADVGLSAQLVTMTSGPAYPEYVDNLKMLAENITTNAWWHQSANYTDNFLFGTSMKYNEAFRERYKRDATYLEASATASCQILVMAIETANSTSGEAVRKVLHERKFDTFYGPVKFDKSGQNNVNAALIMQIQKGNLIVLSPDALKQGTVRANVPPHR